MNTRSTAVECRVFRDAASDYLDGHLNSSDHSSYSDHVRRCEECGGFLRSLAKLTELLSALGNHDNDPNVEAHILSLYQSHLSDDASTGESPSDLRSLWKQLRVVPSSQRAKLVSQLQRFKTRDFCEWLLAESRTKCQLDAHLALELAEAAINVAGQLSSTSSNGNLMAECWSAKAVARLALSDFVNAEKDLQAAERQVPEGKRMPLTKARLLMVRASLLSTLGRPQEAVLRYRECQEIFEELGQRVPAISMQINIGGAHLRSGNPEEARAIFEGAVTLLTADDPPALVFGAVLNLGVTYCELENAKEAERLMPRLVELSAQLPPSRRLHLKWLAGSIARARQDWEDALKRFREVRDLFQMSGEWIHYVECSLDIARVFACQGDWQRLSALVLETKLRAEAMCADEACLNPLRVLQDAVDERAMKESSLRAAGLLLASRLAWRDASF